MKAIIKALGLFLTPQECSELTIAVAVPRSITLCLTIERIVRRYNSSQENEDRVCALLANLCEIHFRKRRS